MEDIWKNLPDDLALKIIADSEPTIDTKIAFNIGPKKICVCRISRIEYLLGSRKGLIYNYNSSTLHDFRISGFHIIRRPYELNWFNEHYSVFNLENDYYSLELYTPGGDFISCPNHNDSLIVDIPILLRG